MVKDRRVQFASGPWDHYVDGHPPEKRCEEDRRSYRHGLTLQQDLEPSLFEHDWFEVCSKATNWWSSDAGYTAVEMNIEADRSKEVEAEFGAQSHDLGLRHDSATSIGGYSPEKSYESEEISQSVPASNECEVSLLSNSVCISMPSCSHFTSGDGLEDKQSRGSASFSNSSFCRFVDNSQVLSTCRLCMMGRSVE